MAKTLRPHLVRFFDYISRKAEGDVLSEAEILSATGWEKSTIQAHRSKNALDPFLAHIGAGQYRVRRDGATISKADVTKAFTQIRPSELVLTPGTRVVSNSADYELVHEIGRGAVAHVWEGLRVPNGKHYAIKVVNPRADLLEPTTLENVKRRFGREARNGMRISHEHIVCYRDHGEIKSHPFLVMDLADESLATRLTKGHLSVSESLNIVACCARGLRHLHESDCVHRDVKPPNILRFGSQFVLGDLGIVKWSDLNASFTSAATITKAVVQLGSWYYMAPEQRQSPHDATPASDIYALGISWYEMLTGVTPDPAAVGAQVFPDPSSVAAVNDLIRRMLKYAQSSRPTAEEVMRLADSISATS